MKHIKAIKLTDIYPANTKEYACITDLMNKYLALNPGNNDRFKIPRDDYKGRYLYTIDYFDKLFEVLDFRINATHWNYNRYNSYKKRFLTKLATEIKPKLNKAFKREYFK